MSKLSPVRTDKLIKLCIKCGWSFDRQKGDHMAFIKPGALRPIIIRRTKTSPVWLILQIIRHLGISRDSFFKYLREL